MLVTTVWSATRRDSPRRANDRKRRIARAATAPRQPQEVHPHSSAASARVLSPEPWIRPLHSVKAETSPTASGYSDTPACRGDRSLTTVFT